MSWFRGAYDVLHSYSGCLYNMYCFGFVFASDSQACLPTSSTARPSSLTIIGQRTPIGHQTTLAHIYCVGKDIWLVDQ